MKVLVCPDSFKGTLTAAAAAAAIADGWASVRPGDEIATVPLADGGDGTVDVVGASVSASVRHTVEIADARGRATSGDWLALPDGTAVVEAAEAVGLAQLPEDERDPTVATSYGVGQMMAAAAHAGSRSITVALGGSATVDGGAGMAIALGHRLRRGDGNGVKVGARWLTDLDRIEAGPPLGVPVDAAVDVTNPLLGRDGAACVYGPQKGATQADVPLLEEALERLADVAERDLVGGPWRDLPGAGAAGGLGFGLAAFCGATLRSGGEWIARLVGFDGAMEGCDVVVFGEGSLDRQTTAHGKIGGHVAAQAAKHGARLLAVAGTISDDGWAAVDDAAELGPEGLNRPAALVQARAAELAARVG